MPQLPLSGVLSSLVTVETPPMMVGTPQQQQPQQQQTQQQQQQQAPQSRDFEFLNLNRFVIFAMSLQFCWKTGTDHQ